MLDFGFDLARRKRRRLWPGIALAASASLAEAVCYVALYRALTAVFDGRADGALVFETVAILAVAFLSLVALRARANIATYSAVHDLVADARLAVADHLGKVAMGCVTTARRSTVAELLSGRFGLYQEVVSRAWGMVVADVALPLWLWLLLAFVDWRMAVVIGSLIPPALLAIPWSHRLLTSASGRLSALKHATTSDIVEQIEGMRELRQFDTTGRSSLSLQQMLGQLEAEQMRSELAPAPALLVFAFILQVGFAVAAACGTVLLSGGYVAPAAFVVFLIVALRFHRALLDLGLTLAELRFARDTLDEIRSLVRKPVLPEPDGSEDPADGSVEFDRVSFSYQRDRETVLKRVSGTVPTGKTLALVGPSGSGKSTLAHLVARLWDVDGGAIRIGGVDIRRLSSPVLHRTVATVLQEVWLFDGTIADNIRLGRPDATDAEVETAARAARAHDFIMALKDGYATRIRGSVTLSGGERQRLAITRALLLDAPVLVLDEATASIDLENEADIQVALSELVQRRTVIVIAHRLWTVADADEIWVLEDGRIAERGTPEALLADESSRYRAMWDRQLRE